MENQATADTHSSHRSQAWDSKTSALLTVVGIGSLPILLLELRRNALVRQDRALIDLVNVVVLVVFSVNYLVGFCLSKDRRHFVRHEWLALVLVISQALVLVPSLAAFGIVRAVRAIRLVRVLGTLLRLAAIGGLASHKGRQLLREKALPLACGLGGLTWLTSAVAFTMVEDVGSGGRLNSFFDALWWSLATITTVGYGDVVPITTAGRIVGGFTMVVGVSVFAVITARFAAFFTRNESESQVDRVATP